MLLTYRQKLSKADPIILVAVEPLDDISNHVTRHRVTSLFKELMEFIITDISVVVEIYRDRAEQSNTKTCGTNRAGTNVNYLQYTEIT